MGDVKDWVESVKALLLFGIDFGFEDKDKDGVHCNEEPAAMDHVTLTNVKSAVDEFLQRSNQDLEKDSDLSLRLHSFLEKNKGSRHDTTELMVKFEHYIKLQLKIQHMSLIRAMYELRRYKSVKDIPSLIFAVRDDVPGVLLPHSRIKKVVMETVTEIKQKLLAQFHKLLEDHLVASQGDSLSGDSDGKSGASRSLWSQFLSQARDWLLAYTMVTLLPVVLTETRAMILEKFQSTLDEALTPTWGRYHFHLQVARKARSSQQIIWTFEYTRSFVSMMCDLSQALTSSGELQKLCDLDYATAGQKQVLEKAAKFMRAHLAQIVVDFSPLSRELCLQLVEETLELDDWMHGIAGVVVGASTTGAPAASHSHANGAAAVSLANGNNNYAPITVCAVLFDAKEMFHQWLLQEHRFFHFNLRAQFHVSSNVFAFMFGNDDDIVTPTNATMTTNNVVASTAKGLSFQATRQRCYHGVYQCMSLFFTACERYKYLPPAAQRIFSICILEPLLCTALGLLLYKTRNNRVLYEISMGTYKPPTNTTNKGEKGAFSAPSSAKRSPFGANETPNSTPEELQEYFDSAQYFQSCLEFSARRQLVSHSAVQFRTTLWSELQSWMPQLLISEAEALNGFSAVDLVDKAWKLSEEFTHDSNNNNHNHNYAYRNPISKASEASSAKGSFLRSGGSGVTATTNKLQQQDDGVCEIGACVDVARGLALTLCDVLQKQLATCK